MNNVTFICRLAIIGMLGLLTLLDWRTFAIQKRLLQAKDRIISTDRIIHLAAGGDAGMFVIHTPEGGCPAGWEAHDGVFIQNGNRRSGCILRRGDSPYAHVDYIEAGETVSLEFHLRPEEDSHATPASRS